MIARVMAVVDALPTIDHMPRRKELSPHVIRNWKSAKNMAGLCHLLHSGDECLEGDANATDEEAIEVGDVCADGLWNGRTSVEMKKS